MPPPETVFIGIGSNLGDPVQHCRTACEHLSHIEGLTLTARSPLYRTDPFGKTDQPAFINAVVQGETRLDPRALLDAFFAIEHQMGRIRREKWGPRIIDLDLLGCGSRVVNEPGLRLPHPGMADRPFVLVPLCDLSPDWMHPVLHQTTRQLLEKLGTPDSVQRLDIDF